MKELLAMAIAIPKVGFEALGDLFGAAGEKFSKLARPPLVSASKRSEKIVADAKKREAEQAKAREQEEKKRLMLFDQEIRRRSDEKRAARIAIIEQRKEMKEREMADEFLRDIFDGGPTVRKFSNLVAGMTNALSQGAQFMTDPVGEAAGAAADLLRQTITMTTENDQKCSKVFIVFQCLILCGFITNSVWAQTLPRPLDKRPKWLREEGLVMAGS